MGAAAAFLTVEKQKQENDNWSISEASRDASLLLDNKSIRKSFIAHLQNNKIMIFQNDHIMIKLHFLLMLYYIVSAYC